MKQGRTRYPRHAGFGLTETLVYAALSSLLAVTLYTGALALQRSFFAAQHFVRTQSEQMRVLDYIALDARCAVNVKTENDNRLLKLLVPDFYDKTDPDKPFARTPYYDLATREVTYGVRANYIWIEYFERNTSIIRKVNGVETVLVTGVEKFDLQFPDAKNPKSLEAKVSFIPKFGRNLSESTMRESNTASVMLLLRNKLG